MAKIVIAGAGFAGHTAALYLGDNLGKKHQITVINKYAIFGYGPSWVWVGIDHMAPEKTIFNWPRFTSGNTSILWKPA